MKLLQFSFLLFMVCLQQIPQVDAKYLCDPDQSIENQKAKKITQQAQALLVKVMKDQISLQWPVEVCKCWVSSLFGPRASGFHNGVDLAALQGTPVFAGAPGVVEVAQKSLDTKGYGNMILLSHTDILIKDEFGHATNYKTRYAHLDKLLVQQGDVVHQGQQIGTVGSTGHVIVKPKSDPSHLHFEVYRGKDRINPLLVLFAADKNWIKLQGV